uniref:protein-tyrosine-phosphatase n=1 Tax=Crassostrea virginica TaxID=6565 RepID=A0A8B8CB02_CRAVI|nr:receptor-type tyrosine-protein phosphatase mu-like [Crassostrea virginica]
MAGLAWLCLIQNLCLGVTLGYENLSRKSGTILSQSTTYQYHWASRANDGNTLTDEKNCAHTAPRETIAWFQVYLGKQYSIKSVKIFYRREGNMTDDWKQYRFRQFYLDVANSSASETTTLTPQRTRCFTDNSTGNNLPPNVIDIPCKQTASYVIVETTYNAAENKQTDTGPMLEICEIEVYGCDIGKYGENCEECPECPFCDVEKGTCRCNNCINKNCNNNGHCIQGCMDQFWGSSCENICASGCLDRLCIQSTGYCSKGCNGTRWGYTCEYFCPSNCKEPYCNIQSGQCFNCKAPYWGDNCDSQCPFQRCVECEQRTGACSKCLQNWTGDQCDSCVATHYGPDCSSECNVNCINNTCNVTGFCTQGCGSGFYGYYCENPCDSCLKRCHRDTGECDACQGGRFGSHCEKMCSQNCQSGCEKNTGTCINCIGGKYGDYCNETCGAGCESGCDQFSGNCACKKGWIGETCGEIQKLGSSSPDIPGAAVGAGVGGVLVVIVAVITVTCLMVRRKRTRQSKPSKSLHYEKSFNQGNALDSSNVNRAYTNLEGVTVAIEDPDEEPQVEKPEECVYYNDLTVAKDIAVTDLLSVITAREAKEHQGFTKEFKSLPYGERFPCDISKTEENMPKNRFKTTFPYDHSRVVLEISKENASDYINANYIENMEGNREFIACQGPRVNTVVDHWRMIWQEHITDIVMLTNLIEGPKIKCHQYWPDKSKELNADPFTISLLEEKVYAYYVIRKMALRKKKVSGSRTVTQFHYTRWPDHGTPNPLNLVVFLGHFRHKSRPSQHPILVHCSAGIGRTGTFIALDVLSRYGKNRGKINVIEYVKAMRKDRMTMIQNVDQYIFLYHALYEFFRTSPQFFKKDEFLAHYGNVSKSERKKQLTEQHNELINLKTKYEAKDFKTGKKYQKLNATKSVLPVERYLVFLTSNIHGREPYYNAVSLSSFKQAEEFVSAQLPVSGAAIDLARLLIDHDCPFIVSLTPFSEVKELKDWVNEDVKTVKMDPYEITKHAQTMLSQDIRRTAFKLKGKEEDIHDVQILECITWGADDQVPVDTSSLINLIKQLDLDRKSHPDGHVVVISRDGAAGCGVFFAVYNALQQLQQDEEVDLVTIVRQLQIRRPEMIATLKEYEFCVDAVCAFLASDNVYANT